jgi:hypothetical protein
MEISNKYKNKMITNQLIITKAGKGKTLVILAKEDYKQNK